MRVVDFEVRTQNPPAKIGAVYFHYSDTEQKSEKVAVVASSQAVIHPRAMMITFRDTDAAESAVFGPCWLDKVAGPADSLWPEENMVKGIIMHPRRVIVPRNVVSSGCNRKVREDVWEGHQQRHGNQQMRW